MIQVEKRLNILSVEIRGIIGVPANIMKNSNLVNIQNSYKISKRHSCPKAPAK